MSSGVRRILPSDEAGASSTNQTRRCTPRDIAAAALYLASPASAWVTDVIMLLAGELSPATVRAVVHVDIVPNMDASGASRIHHFMNDRMLSGFDSLEEVADMIQEYNPHRRRPTDLDGLRTNLRRRDGRWYWHWDPKFIDGTSARPPIEVTEVDRAQDR